jgi:hypothetical protein
MKTIQDLEKAIDKSQITELNLEYLRAILAFEYAKDGMEWNDVLEIWEGKNPMFQTEQKIMETLIEVFDWRKGD